jgi:DNA polymerase-3 subunit chi
MTQVEFFEIRGPRWQHILCEHAERAFATGQRVYLLADSEAAARHLDELLWTFRDDSFVPHGLWQGEAGLDEPVAVGWQEGNPNGADCLLLARGTVPERVDGFRRVIDLAPVDLPELRDAARDRYRAFQGLGLTPAFHRAGRT